MARTWWDRDAKGRFSRSTIRGDKSATKPTKVTRRLSISQTETLKVLPGYTAKRWRPALSEDYTEVRRHQVFNRRIRKGEKKMIGWQTRGISRIG